MCFMQPQIAYMILYMWVYWVYYPQILVWVILSGGLCFREQSLLLNIILLKLTLGNTQVNLQIIIEVSVDENSKCKE